MKNSEYIGCQVYKKDEYDKWKVMLLYKEYLPEGETREIGSEGIRVDYNIRKVELSNLQKWDYHLSIYKKKLKKILGVNKVDRVIRYLITYHL